MEQRLRVGVIASTHGIRGEVKVFPLTEDVNRFRDLKKVYLESGGEQTPLEVGSVKFFKQFAILKFKGIEDINEVEKYKGCYLLVDRKDAIPLEKDEYYIADMIGMDVYAEDGKKIGILEDVMKTGANDVYVVRPETGSQILIPAIRQCILNVDVEGNRMDVHLLEGLV